MKIIKDERIKVYENKCMAEAYVIIMALALIYIVADSLNVNLGFFKDNMVFILFMVGSLYIVIRLTAKGLGSYSPIKGMHPVTYTTIICLIASSIFGIAITVRNTALFMEGKFSIMSVALFLICTGGMFMLTEFICLVIYFISKKREEKEIGE